MSNTAGAPLRKFVAPEIVFGVGALQLVGQAITNLGIRRPLVVSDPGVVQAGWLQAVLTCLDAVGVRSEVFTEVSPNPRAAQVMAGAQRFVEAGCDGLVAVGGGSPIDCAKGIGIVAANRGQILDFEGVDQVPEPMPPMVCIPTTSGSSADVSQFAIISSPDELRKIAIISKAVVPDVALVDPHTLTTMDPYLTACTGLDALTHAIEAYVSLGASPLTNVHALRAIELVSGRLQAAIADPGSIALRSDLMQASLQAGLAFSNASLGAVHAMAHSLGGRLDLAHGECNGLLLEHVMRFNFPEANEAYAGVATALGLHIKGLTPTQIKTTALDYVRHLRDAVGVGGTLADRGVRIGDVSELAGTALLDACLVTNPRRPNRRDIEVVFEEAL